MKVYLDDERPTPPGWIGVRWPEEAIHLLETDGLISVRRGNVGGAVVHQPSAQRTAKVWFTAT